MCTAITLQSLQNDRFFARNMDFSHDIQPEMRVMPQNSGWTNVVNGQQLRSRHAFIGIGQQLEGVLAFFDGVNEKGFAAAALYFAGYAEYAVYEPGASTEPVAAYDLLRVMLGNCASVEELRALLKRVSVVGVADPLTGTVAPLHWIAADTGGRCVVIEQTVRGLAILENPIGVLANAPDFSWHMTNLNNYTEVSSRQVEHAQWGNVRLTAFGQAGGTSALPGGFASPARFARAAFLKTHADTPKGPTEAVITCLHVLESVSIPRGVVMTSRATSDYTKYTACINLRTAEYFFRTQDNPQVYTASLRPAADGSKEPFNYGRLNSPPVTFPAMGTVPGKGTRG